MFERKPALDPAAQLVIVAPDATLAPQVLWSYVERGGKVFFLGQTQVGGDYFGAKTVLTKDFRGSTTPPAGAEFAGLGAGDLRLKADLDWPTLAATGTPGFQRLADGMLGLRKQGNGLAVWAQLGPELLQAGQKEFPEYLRLTRWRQCRAVCQILANLGATFEADARMFHPVVERISLAGPWQVQITQALPLVDWKSKHADPGISAAAKALVASAGDKTGETFELPGWYPPFEKSCGEAVWQREVTLPAEWAGKFVQINIPAIKSYDTVFWNGREVDFTSKDTQKEDPWNQPRKYRVPGELVRAGKNTLAIRQFVPGSKRRHPRTGGRVLPTRPVRRETSGPALSHRLPRRILHRRRALPLHPLVNLFPMRFHPMAHCLKLAALAIALNFPVLQAADYYVATSGNDSASGSISDPFRTIQRAANTAVAGDNVIIRAGVYHETVRPANSGTSVARITYKAYEAGGVYEDVVISGADAITGWTAHDTSGGRAIYKTTAMNWNLSDSGAGFGTAYRNQIFVNGQMMGLARWPNAPVRAPHPPHLSGPGPGLGRQR